MKNTDIPDIYDKLEKILIQTTKTNWRVNRAEKDIIKNEIEIKENKKEIKEIQKTMYKVIWWITVIWFIIEKLYDKFF
jgi:hypothetical protein